MRKKIKKMITLSTISLIFNFYL